MTTFVLVHGGGHRSSHWDLLRPVLEARGYTTVAPDVPMDVPGMGAAAWAEVVLDTMRCAGDPSDVVMVGHSLAGLALPLIAAQCPVQAMVFLCANIPVPGMSYSDYLLDHPDALHVPPGTTDVLGRLVVAWPEARRLFYADCDERTAYTAWEWMNPMSGLLAFEEVCPLAAWPETPGRYVLCQDDKVVDPDWARTVSVELFGAPAVELPGGHSPFLSRPYELAEALETLADELTVTGH